MAEHFEIRPVFGPVISPLLGEEVEARLWPADLGEVDRKQVIDTALIADQKERSMAEAVVTDIERANSRPFTSSDAMTLIIALALGLAVARPAIVLVVNAIHSVPQNHFRTMAGAVQLGRVLNIIVLNFLFFLLPAFLILRLKRPRAPLRSMIDQPGFAACATSVAIVLAFLPFELLPLGFARQVMEITAPVVITAAGPLAWVSLIATRRWDPEPSWIDRLGRILGALWMVTLPASFIVTRLPY
jgi:hypothetical protein